MKRLLVGLLLAVGSRAVAAPVDNQVSVNGVGISPASVTTSQVPGFTGDGSGLTNVVMVGSSATYVNVTTGSVTSSYTFVSANSFVYLATAAVSTRGGRTMFVPASIQVGSTGTSTTFCCGIYINGLFPSGESYRCQAVSNTQSEMVMTPTILGVSTASTTQVSLVCTVSQVSVGLQQVWSARVSGFEF